MPGRPALWTHGVTFVKPKHPWTSVSPGSSSKPKFLSFKLRLEENPVFESTARKVVSSPPQGPTTLKLKTPSLETYPHIAHQ